MAYRADIDGLRALAVLAVVIFHAFPDVLPGGFIEVDVFFVISGFLITTLILRSQMTGDFSFRDFYARRARRIFPALILVLALTLAIGWHVLLNSEFQALGQQAVGGALFVANFVFWATAGYFDTAAETKPLLHLWSLGIEEQFYLLWPLLLGVAWRRRWPVVRLLWVLAVLSFLVNAGSVHSFRAAAFYSPLSRFWELMAGAILACMRLGVVAPRPWLRHAQSVLGLALIALGLVATRRDHAFPGWWALLPVLGAIACIAAGPAGCLNRYLLSNRVLVGVGLISYPLYLWHWPLLALARVVGGGTPAPDTRAAIVGASVLLAWATYRFVERPVRSRPGATVPWALWGAGGALVLAGWAILSGMPARNSDASFQRMAHAMQDRDYYAGFATEHVAGHAMRRIGDGARQVLLIGDSHVMQYAPRALKLAQASPRQTATVHFFTLPACPPVPGIVASGHPECDRARDEAMRLARDPRFDAVLIGGCWNCYFQDRLLPPSYGFLQGDTPDDRRSIPRAFEALAQLLADLVRRDKKVYLLLNQPTGAEFAPERLIKNSRLGRLPIGNIPKAPLSPTQSSLNDRLARLAAATGAQAIDAMGHLCADGLCVRTLPDHSAAYYDNTHLRATFSREFATWIDPVFSSGLETTGQ
ncbi:MAG: acyltransferase family protein [Pseudomonadota bacterium]